MQEEAPRIFGKTGLTLRRSFTNGRLSIGPLDGAQGDVMWSKVISVLGWGWGKKEWLVASLGAALLASLAWGYVQGTRLGAERANHETTTLKLAQTQADLSRAVAEAARWADVAKLAQAATTSMKATAQAAIEREARTRLDASERKQILSAAKPRQRTATETTEVVDDDTRHRAAARLNRPL